jgi:hypothetical protein
VRLFERPERGRAVTGGTGGDARGLRPSGARRDEEGLHGGRVGRLSSARPSPGIGGMLGLYQERSSGSTVMRLHLQLQKHHQYKLKELLLAGTQLPPVNACMQLRRWVG